jgi:site-specific recombinase XerD
MQQDLRQLHTQFMDYSEFTRQVSPRTLHAYKESFELLVKRYPELTSDQINSDLLNDFFKWLQTRPRPVGKDDVRRGVKKSTIVTHWRRLSKFFGWLQAKGMLTANPLRSKEMQCPSVSYEDKQYLSRRELEKILGAITFTIAWKSKLLRTRNLAIFSVAVNCGLRRGELLALRVTDLDLVRNQVTVRAETSKSRNGRTIPLNSRVRKDLEEYLSERRRSAYRTEFLWVSENMDARLTGDGLRHLLGAIIDASGVRFHMHQLRHTFAVNFLHNSGKNAFKLQGLLGHRTIVSTAIYTRCLPMDAVRGDIERLGRLDNTL